MHVCMSVCIYMYACVEVSKDRKRETIHPWCCCCAPDISTVDSHEWQGNGSLNPRAGAGEVSVQGPKTLDFGFWILQTLANRAL